MFRLIIQLVAILACIHASGVFAQDQENLGTLLPAGQSAARLPLFDRYSGVVPTEHPFRSGKLGSILEAVEHAPPTLRLRGAKEIDLYRALSGSVPLLLAGDALGAGALIAVRPGATGIILTNWHVIAESPDDVGVVFKPKREGEKFDRGSTLRGRVVKVDPQRDLALVEVIGVPAGVVPISLGEMKEVKIGADVHAIGHPAGQTWTYTKGLISQVRTQYEWGAESSRKHVADIIQTQTPLNPGNSGGPLISDSSRLIGINSFKKKGEALNFAVSIGEVQRFLAAAERGEFERKPEDTTAKSCEVKVLYEGRAPYFDAFIRNLDLDCSGKSTATLHVPDDEAKPVTFRIDRNRDGKADAWIFDDNRDGKWDRSFWDEDFDGKPDLIGFHPDGEINATRFEKYQPKG